MAERGLVDLQVNGHGGVDFSDPRLQPEAAARACRGIIAGGTAAFLATVITRAPSTYARVLPVLAELAEQPTWRGRLLGIHCEGPFLHPHACGVHPRRWLRPCDADTLARMQDLARGHIRLLTIAADLPGAPGLIRQARRLGMVVALGHHLADADDLARAADAGATALTHLGNGLPAHLPRHPNPLWDGLAAERLWMMLIPDGHHLAWSVLRVLLRAGGAQRVVLVSDATAAAGVHAGPVRCFGRTVRRLRNGRVETRAGALCGAGLTLSQAVARAATALAWSPAMIHSWAIAQPRAVLTGEPPP